MNDELNRLIQEGSIDQEVLIKFIKTISLGKDTEHKIAELDKEKEKLLKRLEEIESEKQSLSTITDDINKKALDVSRGMIKISLSSESEQDIVSEEKTISSTIVSSEQETKETLNNTIAIKDDSFSQSIDGEKEITSEKNPLQKIKEQVLNENKKEQANDTLNDKICSSISERIKHAELLNKDRGQTMLEVLKDYDLSFATIK